jgi:hypothetical protein
MARKRHHSDATDENTNDFAFPVRGKWMEDTLLLFTLYLLIAAENYMAEMPAQ